MHYESRVIFYLLVLVATLVFAGGMAGLIHLWRLGKEPSLNRNIQVSQWVRYFLRAVFFQAQIRENGVYIWIAHLCIFYGFMSLLLLTTLEFFLDWFVPANAAILEFFKSGPGNPVLALWGDFWGLVLLAGVLMALYRRYVKKPEILNTIAEDAVALWLLLAIILTGYLCEAVRLAARPESIDLAQSFAVAWLVPLLSGSGLSEGWVTSMFYFHGILSLGFIAYIPFGKLRHIIASPLTYSCVSAGDQYTKI